MDLASTRPVWRIPAWAVQAVREAFGAGWALVEVTAPAVSDGDGAAPSGEAVSAARGAEVYLGWGVPEAVVQAAAGTLRWAHSAAAGVGASITPALIKNGAVLTNSRGIHAEPMADWVVTAIGMCARGFVAAGAAQRRRRWIKDAFTDGRVPVRELADVRVGLVGMGGIGRAVTRRLVALGISVRAVRRHPSRDPLPGVEWVGGPDDLLALAAQSDVLVIAAPHTSETRHLVNDRVLAALPDGASVINVSRGALLDEAALMMHLEGDRLAGAVLDVFAVEPLPADHPLWDHPKVIVTPHVSAVSDRFWERETDLIVRNVRRYLAGQPLENVVNLEAGY